MKLPFKTIRQQYSVLLIVFVIIISVLTIIGIKQWVQPNLRAEEEKNLSFAVKDIATEIKLTLAAVQAQQRATTQLIPTLESNQIDKVLPYIVDQYGNELVFGGGIWPLPNMREQGVDRASTFFHRDSSGKLIENTYWNSDEAPSYYTQPWHISGQQAPKGECVWANAYKDGASTQPRTNCAMAIYQQSKLYGVSTVDVTLGFFNTLVSNKEKELNAEILIVESDGKILSKNQVLTDNNVILSPLKNQTYAMATALDTALKNNEFRLEYSQDDEDHTLLIQKIEGTPWLVAVSKPTRLLSIHTTATMNILAKIQFPMIILLLLVLLYAFKNLGDRFNHLKQNVDTLSAGDADLSMRLPVKGEDELDAVSESMNHFIAYLQQLIQKVLIANKKCSEQIELMSIVTQQTSAILESHVKETDIVAAAVNELSSSSKEVARHTTQSTEITNQAQEQAIEASQSSNEATEGVGSLMNNVESTAQNVTTMQENAVSIESVLQVIGGIAEQTNLLALNAAIEAARAGEQGRGFAVVADEVRNLAAKTQQSTSVVAEMLDTLKRGVETTVSSMNDTKEQCIKTSELTNKVTDGITVMRESVINVDDISLQIATAAKEQSEVADGINQSMESIRTMLDELYSKGQDSKAHAQALENANTELQTLVGQFKL